MNNVDTINYFLSLIQLLRTVLTRSNSQRSNSFTTNSNDTINTQTTTVHNLLNGIFKPIQTISSIGPCISKGKFLGILIFNPLPPSDYDRQANLHPQV